MAEGRFRSPRIRMPRVSLPTRSRRASTSGDEPATATKPEASTKTTEPVKATESTKAPTGAKTATGPTTPQPNLQERMEGLQGWMAEIERKQARISYFGALALLIAIAAAGAALYFGLTTRSDSAKKSDLDALSGRVNSLEGAVTKNTKDTQNALNASIAQLQSSIAGLQKKQSQTAANLSTLQSQVASGALNKPGATPGAAAGGATAGAVTTTPTTPKKP
jgi:uncharacterized protein HemX